MTTNHRAPLDWDRFIAEYRERIGSGVPAPLDCFPDKNFMADEVLSFHPLTDGCWAEVSTGTFGPDRVIGITVAAPGDAPWSERSRGVETFLSVGEAADHLRRLGAEV